jgi:hypothetical protein
LIARENTWPNPIITISSNNQTFGVILVFIHHLLIGFVCGQTDMYTVYNKGGQKASCLPVPECVYVRGIMNPLGLIASMGRVKDWPLSGESSDHSDFS